jgi:hypothetical protein
MVVVRPSARGRRTVNQPAHSVPRLVTALVDDAGLFPPERLPMGAAVTRHRKDGEEGHPLLTQRFLCPASRLGELREHLGTGESWDLGLILDDSVETLPATVTEVARDPRLRLATVELRLPSGRDEADSVTQVVSAASNMPVGVPVHVELDLAVPGWDRALVELEKCGLGAKVRCGGIEAHLFPSVDQLAAFIMAAVRTGIAFKATAGLHHAVRYRDPSTGFHHHGFLNILIGLCRGVDGHPLDRVRDALTEDDGRALADEALAIEGATAAKARELFVAYGSCSTRDPISDLNALGLVALEDA